MAVPVLEMRQIYKAFPGVVAVNKVDLVLYPSEVLALIGENGAGKSTLIKILAGAHTPDGGEILINGEAAAVTDPGKGLELGISVIYQELNYLNHMTIAENIFLGQLPVKGGRVDYQALREKSSRIQELVGLERRDPMTPLGELTVGEKQLVEIGKACARNVKILVMDEPTSALTIRETEQLFGLMENLTQKGISVIYISHKMEEIERVSSRVQVMRDGRSVGVWNTKEISRKELIRNMVGRDLTDMYPVSERTLGKEVLKVENLETDFLKDVSLNLRQGEILGLYGLMGSGCGEVLRCIFGAQPRISGKIILEGREAAIRSPREAVKNGLAYVPGERKTEGLILSHDIQSNILLSSIRSFCKVLGMDTGKERAAAEEWAGRLHVKAPDVEVKLEALSGGNQQKVILARWMLTNPRILLLDEPTKGIDVGAKAEIYRLLEEFCRKGLSVIFISSEMPEVMNIADRVVVLHEGAVAAEYEKETYTQETIMRSAIGE